jgi:predicted HD superfamily hydrolase involved in NAD metabolism
MHALLSQLIEGIELRGDLPTRVRAFLIHSGYPKTVLHSQLVAGLAVELAGRFGADPVRAEAAGWLHDVSVVFLNNQRMDVAFQLGLDLLPEEISNPIVAHQKLSVILASQIFHMNDPEVLSAIGCHTTLKPGASPLDKVVFVADKIAWNQSGNPPYLQELEAELRNSLDGACVVYLRSLAERRTAVSGPLHSLASAALAELQKK